MVATIFFFRYDWGMETKPAVLVLIDSNAIIHRAYHALPKTMSLSSGEMTNAVYGYTTTLIKVLEDLKPDYIAASFDLAGPTFRHDEYKEYKATRVKADQELYDQIPRVRELLESLNIPVYEKEGFEADDIIGTIVQKIQDTRYKIQTKSQVPSPKSQNQIFIVTGDKDAFQLVDGNVFVYNLKHGLSNAQIVYRAEIEKDWKLQPEDFIDLKALAGDPSDNIHGVPGIGNKTATDLLIKFDTLKKLYEKIESFLSVISAQAGIQDSSHGSPGTTSSPTVGPEDDNIIKMSKEFNVKPRILKLLITNKDQAFLSQRLATIRRDVPLNFKLEDFKWGDYDKIKVKEFFEKMGIHSLLRRFGAAQNEPVKTKPAEKQAE